MTPVTYDEFERRKFFTALDGVRAISVVLVIIWHMPEKSFWGWLNGYAGVQSFFVLSGFLITTLCLREMMGSAGALSLKGFYLRRVYRILPMYVLTLLAYAALTRAEIIPSWSSFLDKLPYYLTLNADLIQGGHPFHHSWTLGVEEKFYVIWPILLILIFRLRSSLRVSVTAGMLGGISVLAGLGIDYATNYVGITFGCLLAFTVNDRSCFAMIRRCASRRLLVAVILLLTVLTHLLLRQVGRLTLPYAVLVGMSIAGILLRQDGRLGAALSTAPARWIGKRSYGIYLVHPIVIHLIGRMINPTGGVAVATLRLLLAIVGSFALADVLSRLIEEPMIRRGRARAKKVSPRQVMEVAPISTDLVH